MHVVLALYGPSMTLNYGYLKELRHNERVPEAALTRIQRVLSPHHLHHNHRTQALFSSDKATKGFFTQNKHVAWAFRAAYFLRVMVLPWYVSGVPLYVGVFYVSLVCGAVLTLLFVVSHNFEDSDRAPSPDPKKGPIDWYKAQVETSCTYGGWAAMFLTGGLNLQIEHHCFPRMSSWHYPAIAQAVRECCKEHGVKYTYFLYLWSNLRSTWAYMRKVGIAKVLSQAHED